RCLVDASALLADLELRRNRDGGPERIGALKCRGHLAGTSDVRLATERHAEHLIELAEIQATLVAEREEREGRDAREHDREDGAERAGCTEVVLAAEMRVSG